ncbi:MAG: S8 family peptidase [Planctomycetes bacterium]|nr:S8 family peptidase [Planctomycetota bacterium]
MPEKPILIFPTAKRTNRHKRSPAWLGLALPLPAQQRQRLDAKFRRIVESFASVQFGITGLDPEQVIVLEVIDDIVDLAKAAEKVPGLEWLTELDLDDIEPADGFVITDEPDQKVPLRLFALMTNQQAMQQMIGLWDQWSQHPEKRATKGFGPFKNVFKQLWDVRLWGPKDRLLDTGVVDSWKENLQFQVDQVRFQAELWCRQSDDARTEAFRRFNDIVQQLGGQCVRERAIPEIMYHGVLVDIPRTRAEEAVTHITNETYTELLRCDKVMFFRPSAQMASPISENPGVPFDIAGLRGRPVPAGPPVVALLDGCPLENHVALANRLAVDDPDGLAAQYLPGQQQHGTAMASLIVHGDLSAPGDPLPKPVYVRPIFVPFSDFSGQVNEAMPFDQLPVDVIERAVRRLFEPDGNEPAAASSVRVINLSIGDASLPFHREISPLARLLDWLAWKYNVLFLVSAGNQVQDLVLDCTRAELTTKSEEEILRLTVCAILKDQSRRRPFCPAEAVNVVTVGSVHADRTGSPPLGYRRDPFSGRRLPSPLSTVSGGFRRAIKPEIMMEGGRQVYHEHVNGSGDPATLKIHPDKRAPGQQVAAPGRLPAELNQTAFCRGTSNATALASRTAGMAYERLASLVNEPGGERLAEEWMAVILKALLVHGASWTDSSDVIEQAAPPNLDRRTMTAIKRKLLGYGEVEPTRLLAGTEKRVLLLGWDRISTDEGHEYLLPLPPALASVRYKRRLTVTLGWISPVNLRHRAYRQAALVLDIPATKLREALGLGTAEVNRNDSARGTVQHMVFEGDDAIPFVDGAELMLKVNCRADAGKMEKPVRYALAVTLEVADPVQIDIYSEILQLVRARARVPATGN